MVTAGHCLCATLKEDPDRHQDALCKPRHHNQIVVGVNEIKVYGGSKDTRVFQSSMNKEYTFSVKTAFIMDDPKNDNFIGTTDIGILITDSPLFNKVQVAKSLLTDATPPILPICLAAEDINFDEQDLYGVGWGWTYDESPKGETNRDPYYSTCMTNEVGKARWRFKHCNMKQIQKLKWSCEKNELPPDINKADLDRCKKYFDSARQIFQGTDKSNINFMDRINKIFVYEGKPGPEERYYSDSQKKLVCYSEKEFTETGWCEVRGHSSSNGAWGFCSPSCNKQLMQV